LPVINMGMIEDELVLVQLYSAADLTVVPSRSESFGQVASESLACGTPVVAFKTSGLKDIVQHMTTGYLAEDFQTEDLAKGIRLLAEDAELCSNMSIFGRKKAVEVYDISITAQKHIATYENLIKANK